MKSPSTTLIRSALAVTVGLLLVVHGSFAAAARPSAAHAQSSKSKLPKARRKNSADTNRPKPPAADLDGSEARDTLESALENYETMLAVIANNIANADTPGFKRSLAIVEDLGYRQEGLPGVQDSSGNYSPNGFSIGSGSQIAGTEIDFRQGRLKWTVVNWTLPLKAAASSRSRILPERSSTAELGTSRKMPVVKSSSSRPRLAGCWNRQSRFPPTPWPSSISPEGVVSYRVPDQQTLTQAGTIQMANFINPQGLLKIGENLYEETEGSGCATTGSPGSSGSGIGKIRQGWIEQSNVDLRQEMAEWKRIRQTCRTIRSLLEEQ